MEAALTTIRKVEGLRYGPQNKQNYGIEKDLLYSYSAVAVRDSNIEEPVILRVYTDDIHGPEFAVFAAIWINGKGYSAAGTGYAGIYRYYKTGDAIQAALDSAGVVLSYPTGEIEGEHTVEAVLTAIVRALGFKDAMRVILTKVRRESV